MDGPFMCRLEYAQQIKDHIYMNRIRSIQLNYKDHDTNVRTVGAMGSTFLPDQKHLDTMSQIRVGQKMAAAFLSSFDGHHPQ
jgi:hypothetical protein